MGGLGKGRKDVPSSAMGAAVGVEKEVQIYPKKAFEIWFYILFFDNHILDSNWYMYVKLRPLIIHFFATPPQLSSSVSQGLFFASPICRLGTEIFKTEYIFA